MRARTIGAAIAATALLGGLTLAAASASSGPSHPVVVAGAADTAAGSSGPTTPAPSSTQPGATGTAGAAGATVAPTTSGHPAATGAKTPATSGHPAPTPATTAAASPPQSSAPSPATPGTYRYRQTSSPAVEASEGTLVVAPAASGGTQVWTRNMGGTVKPSSTTMLFNRAGTFMVSPNGQLAGTSGTCAFSTPLPWPPWPATVGATFSGQATCSGPVHTMTISGQIDRTDALALDGTMVDTFRVVSTLVMKGSYNGSPISVTQTDTNWYAASLPVPVKTQTHLQGSVIGIPLTIDSTGVLESSKPS